MATRIKNNSDGDLTLPPVYGSAILPPGGEVLIADTPTNVSKVIATPGLAGFLRIGLVPDGQAGAIVPLSAGVINNQAAVGSPLALTAAQSGSTITTAGAGAQTGSTLPASAVGLEFTFLSETASGFRVFGNGADTIQYLTNTSTATTGHLDGTTNGAAAKVKCYAAGLWQVISALGTVAVT